MCVCDGTVSVPGLESWKSCLDVLSIPLICGLESSHNLSSMVPMSTKSREILEADNLESLADKGYFSADNIKSLHSSMWCILVSWDRRHMHLFYICRTAVSSYFSIFSQDAYMRCCNIALYSSHERFSMVFIDFI